jgi:hypothetical protein
MRTAASAVALLLLTCTHADAQWLKLTTPNVPRAADGKLDTNAPAPRVADRPDLSGLWRYETDAYTNDVTIDLKAEEIQPAVRGLSRRRREDLGRDDPATFRCLPAGPRHLYAPQNWVRIVQTSTVIVMIYEDLTSRQIFMDGRPLPTNPNPSFMGYSIGRWDGDTLVVESVGFNDTSWLDFSGHAHTEALRTTERITRRRFGRLDIEVKIDDRALYSRPFIVPVHAGLVIDTEMLESVCNENQKDVEHMVGKASDERKFAVKIAPAILSRYVGRYSLATREATDHTIRLNVTLADGTLSMDIDGKDRREMIPLSETMFTRLGIRIEFIEENGRTDGLVFHTAERDISATKDR